MTSVLAQLPQGCGATWEFFQEISQVPRGSGNCEHIKNKLLEIGHRLGLEAAADASGNVVIRKPATAGYETVPSVCLQCHMDMVCEKTSESTHDFEKDPIQLRIVNDTLMATGTTLGADDGIGDAMILSILADKNLHHGPIEGLFTVDEETTMRGAQEIQAGFLHSNRLINVDSEEDWRVCIGCAGGFETNMRLPLNWVKPTTRTSTIKLELSKLQAGHSGVEINQGRGNAIKFMARIVRQATKIVPYIQIASFNAGSKKNVIPGSAICTIVVPTDRVEETQRALGVQFEQVKEEYKTKEKEMIFSTHVEGKNAEFCLCSGATCHLIDMIYAVPHGVTRMSPDVEGLVQTSTNLAKLTVAHPNETALFEFFSRSSSNTELDHFNDYFQALGRLFHAQCSPMMNQYPGWLPNPESPLLKASVAAFKAVYNKDPEIYAIHAGLECGMFQAKYPGMDCVSVGPWMQNVHSPRECLYFATVPKTYGVLAGIVASKF